MNCTIYRDESGFAALRAQWNELLSRSRFDALFLTWEWQTTWWRCLGQGELWLLAWRDGQDLVGIAPLFCHRDAGGAARLSIVGCIEVSDTLDLIIAAGYEEQVYLAFLDWLNGPEAPPWDVVSLCNLPEQSLSHSRLPELAASQGLTATVQVDDVCPIIDLPGDWETFLETQLDKKQRHEVRRKLRKIEREAQSLRWHVVDGASDLAGEMDAFIDLHRLSKRDKYDFMTPQMQRFFRHLTQAMHDAGWLYLAFLEINGDKAAAMLAFDYHSRLLVYNSGYDPGKYSDLSPGIVLTSYAIHHAIERGCRVFDFLQGNEVYKYRFGASDTLVYHTQISRSAALIPSAL